MQRLFEFLYSYRAFLLFVLLEAFCAWLIVNNNPFQGAAFFNSSNAVAGTIMSASSATSDYFRLGEVNATLAAENAQLKTKMSLLGALDSTQQRPLMQFDSTITFIPAKVVNNSTRRFNNFLTLNKGSADGIEMGMGVVSSTGVVGRVKSVSKHFATVVSVLHTSMRISARITSSNTLCTVQWDGKDPLEANVLYVPRHLKVKEGDTLSTSGFNSLYPIGTQIGIISSVKLNESDAFYTIRLRLSTDYYTLSYVYVVKDALSAEKNELEKNTLLIDED